MSDGSFGSFSSFGSNDRVSPRSISRGTNALDLCSVSSRGIHGRLLYNNNTTLRARNAQIGNEQPPSKPIRKIYLTVVIPFLILNIFEAFFGYIWLKESALESVTYTWYWMVGILSIPPLSIALYCNKSSVGKKIFMLMMCIYFLLKLILFILSLALDPNNNKKVYTTTRLVLFSFETPIAVVLIVDFVLYFIQNAENGLFSVANSKDAQKCVIALCGMLMPSFCCLYVMYNAMDNELVKHENDGWEYDESEYRKERDFYCYQMIHYVISAVVISLMLISYSLNMKFKWNALISNVFIMYLWIILITGLFVFGIITVMITEPLGAIVYVFYSPYLIVLCVAIKKTILIS